MVCTANELSAWKDFPKGLRVLLLEEDSISAEEIKSKLEAMDYIVSLFCNENEALSAISDKPESFHVAIVEVSTSNSNGNFKFLETAKDLPTIMTSNIHCLSTMMKCIALGAVEFLRKPLSEEKLRNIWQHVVHKAFNAGGNVVSDSLKPVNDSGASIPQLKVETEERKNKNLERTENVSPAHENEYEQSPLSDKYPAPSTPQLKQGASSDGSAENPNKASRHHKSYGTKVNRKKMKVDWTPELHKKFVQAVEQLGVDQAIPSRILEMMKVEGLTRHNVASHLQKFRMHKRHILPKENDRRWSQQRDQIQRNYYAHKPVMAYPPYHTNHTFPMSPVYPMWGATGSHPAGVPMWASPGYPPWVPTESWHWKPYPGMHAHADAWGCPVAPPPHNPYSSSPQNTAGFRNAGTVDNSCSVPQNSFDQYPSEEVIDKVVKEAINKPWLPLPLGLKPPSTDLVLAELSRQGISRVPPHINDSHSI
ncbi:transcription factor, putative [Ricinus communis]|uniref:Transcription factor, putative n=1 Tax=Ricinus communis TaxID=3988 RepID=B9SNR6_RICCO|nr:transcription factor, putative [Ricinus communis]